MEEMNCSTFFISINLFNTFKNRLVYNCWILFFMLPNILISQDCDVLFYYFDGGNFSNGTVMDFTDDKGYILSATTTEFGAVGKDIQVIRVDQFGNEIWSKTYGGSDDDIATDVETIDDGFLVLGHEEISYYEGASHLIRLDNDGNVIWDVTYGNPQEKIEANSMIIDDEGNIVVAGKKSYWGLNYFDSDVILLKYDFDGNLLEQQIVNFWMDWGWNYPPDFGNVGASSVIQTSDGNYLFTGLIMPRVGYVPVKGHTIIFKTDKFFNTLWNKDYHTCNHCNCLADGVRCVEDVQGNIYVAVVSKPNLCYDDIGSEVVVLKLDSIGEYIWDADPISGLSNDLIITSDGNLVLASKSGLVKMDKDGELLWEKEFEEHHVTNQNHSLNQKTNSDLVVSGYRYDQGGDIFIAITDSLGNSCTNLVEGFVYFDENGNCLVDSSEHPLPQFLVELNPGPMYDITNSEGYYRFVVDTGDFELSIHPINDLWSTNCPPSQTYDIHFSDVYESSDSTDFGMAPADLCPFISVDMAWTGSRICMDGLILLEYCNFGAAAEDNLQVILTLPGELTIVDADHPWAQSGNVATFEVGELEIGECGIISIQSFIDCDAVLGEEVCLSVEAFPDDPCAGMFPPSKDTLCRILTNSYDPNDKLGLVNNREICFDENASIAYTIRFQNTGNDTAYRVMILDTLSESFDIRTIDLGPSSHPYIFEIQDSNILMWIFDDINLPDSTTNFLGSMGAAQFHIQSTLQTGLSILNNAAIYFDYNPPIITPVSQINACNEFSVSAEIQTAICGECYGAIDLTVEGNTGPYTYIWSQGSSSEEDLFDLCPGSYTVIVTDSFGNTETGSFEVPETPSMQVSATTSHPTCGEWNGTIDLSVSGGSAPYTYLWTGPGGPGCPPIPNQTGLAGGEYSATITDSDGCQVIVSISLNISELITTSLNQTDASCGICNGAIETTVNGGTLPFTYEWNTGQNDANLTDLCPGVYVLTVTDAEGCTMVSPEIEIIGIQVPEMSISSSAPSCASECDGSILILMENGTPPFNYDWFPDEFDGQTNLINLCDGNYELTITDSLGCSISANILLEEPESLEVLSIIQASCFGACDGSAELFVEGGTPPYEYENLIDLCPGEYQIMLTDANGCMVTEELIVPETEEITVSIDSIGHTIEGQSNGFIQINAGGGLAPFEFEWTVNGQLISVDQNPIDLSDGSYFVNILDANGCSQNFGPFIVDILVSLKAPNLNETIQIFPNPTSGLLHFQFNSSDPIQGKYLIFDALGTKILKGKIEDLSNNQLDLKNAAEGIYFVKVETERQIFAKKIIVLK